MDSCAFIILVPLFTRGDASEVFTELGHHKELWQDLLDISDTP